MSGGTVRYATSQERAQAAILEFNKVRGMLTSFARAITGNKAISVVAKMGMTYTDGVSIFIEPPLAMADKPPHNEEACNRTDALGVQLCKACEVLEEVLFCTYHEIAHVWGGSFDEIDELSRAILLKKALADIGVKMSDAKIEAMEEAIRTGGNSYSNMANALSPWVWSLWNALEDARVNRKMGEARPGIERMRRASERGDIEQERLMPDGTIKHIKFGDREINLQAAIGLYIIAVGDELPESTHEKVCEALADPRITDLLADTSSSSSTATSFTRAIKSYLILREHDLFGGVPPEEEPEPEPELEPEMDSDEESDDDAESEGDETDDESGDDSDDDQETDASLDKDPEASEDSDGEADDESGSDREPQPQSDAEPDRDEQGGDEGDEAEGDESEGPGAGDSGEPDESDGEEAQGEEAGDGAGDVDGEGQGDQSEESNSDEMTGDGTPGDTGSGGGPGGGGAKSESGQSASDEPASDGAAGEAPLPNGKPTDGSGGAAGTDTGDDEFEDGEESPSGSAQGQHGEGDIDEGGTPGQSSGASSSAGTGQSDADDSVESDGEELSGDDGDTGPIDSGEFDGTYVESHQETTRGAAPYDEAEQVRLSEEVHAALQEFFGHHEEDETLNQGEDLDDIEALERVLMAVSFFDMVPRCVDGVRVHTYKKHVSGIDRYSGVEEDFALAWTHRYGGAKMPDYYYDRLGIRGDFMPPPGVIGSVVQKTRSIFADNQRSKKTPHLRSGRVNPAVLGKRAPLGDARLFAKKDRPGKRSYSVVIGGDISGSTRGSALVLIKRAIMAQAEVLDRLGIPFEVWMHSAKESSRFSTTGFEVDMYLIKDTHHKWNDETRRALSEIGPDSHNLDGHTVQFYRKRLDLSNATDKILMYYTDGQIPAANAIEEAEVLRREIGIFGQKGYKIMAVGVFTDSPKDWGFPTVRIDRDADLVKVVDHIKSALVE